MVNVRTVERDQLVLMPPSLSDWLPSDHLVWFIVDVVAELDMSGFYWSLRSDGRGGASYDPVVILGILLYAYCVGERSSRRIEQRLCDDVAFRVIAANQQPDHATLARFRRRHQEAIAGVFSQVVALCVSEGLVRSGVVAIDGTKIEADVSAGSLVTRRQIVDEILKEAEAVDAAEDLEYGARRGDELPVRWADRRDRRVRLREALRQLDADGPSDAESYQADRTVKEAALGRKLGGRRADPTTKWASAARTRRINVTDPDSRTLKDRRRFIWGYNAQAAVTEDQIVVAAQVTTVARDSVVFEAMVVATEKNLVDTGADPVETFVADTGYWSIPNATLDIDAEVLITPMPLTGGITDPDDPRLAQRREVIERLNAAEVTVTAAAAEMGVSTTTARKLLRNHRAGRPDSVEVRQAMVERLATEHGAAAYAKRKTTVETVFGNIKANLGFRRFSNRGLDATSSEWRLVCTVHNLLKIHRQRLAAI
ncbi:MAG: IS1182 family transposase [Acidobacteria bacterium]|nr:IS1182 family transposase [Acidobacteriota bacterium]